ncbi:hypothetical protein BX600DRAFT_437676 [Xylariales sp. PMI_506]|nr:hypothetical protein BX600DRAFT_437676 [Xylariales sp. PMI_506]
MGKDGKRTEAKAGEERKSKKQNARPPRNCGTRGQAGRHADMQTFKLAKRTCAGTMKAESCGSGRQRLPLRVALFDLSQECMEGSNLRIMIDLWGADLQGWQPSQSRIRFAAQDVAGPTLDPYPPADRPIRVRRGGGHQANDVSAPRDDEAARDDLAKRASERVLENLKRRLCNSLSPARWT